MKSKSKWLWLIAIIGLTAISCDIQTTDNGNQTTAHVHSAGAAATCTTPQICTTCGEVMQTAKGHDFGDDSDWAEDVETATCTDPSHDTRDCKNAPCTVKDKRAGSHPALGHNIPGAYPATCMADGFTGIGHCTRCGEDETGKTLPREPDNHDFSGTPVITPATCTTDGEEVVNCGNNGCTKTHETVLDALGHKWNSVSGTIECDRDRDDCTLTLVEYIQNSAHTGTAADPVPLKVSIELTGMAGYTRGTAFTQLLTALTTGDKLVALDLSGSYRSSDGEFSTGNMGSAAPGPAGLRQIVSIVLPETTVTSIYARAFENCTNLTSITIPNNVTNIGGTAFSRCTGLTSITIPNSVISIDMQAFQYCTGLTSVTIPDNVTIIGDNVFYRCTGLTSITIPASVTSIGNGVFSYNALTSITVDAANQHYTIQNGILYNKTMTEFILMPYGIITGNVTIPDNVTSIAANAFTGCTVLTSITIPDSVTSIGGWVFSNCTALTSVIVLATTPPTLAITNTFNGNHADRKIYVPADSVEAYKAAEIWSTYESVIQAITE